MKKLVALLLLTACSTPPIESQWVLTFTTSENQCVYVNSTHIAKHDSAVYTVPIGIREGCGGALNTNMIWVFNTNTHSIKDWVEDVWFPIETDSAGAAIEHYLVEEYSK